MQHVREELGADAYLYFGGHICPYSLEHPGAHGSACQRGGSIFTRILDA